MNCSDMNDLVSLWEKTGTVNKTKLEEMQIHINGCTKCYKQYSRLIPLIIRDGLTKNAIAISGSYTSIDLTDKIMNTIKNEKNPLGKKISYRAFIYAAAALMIFALSFGLITQRYAQNADNDYYVIEFKITVPEAKSVSLVGDFTDWNNNKIVLRDPDGDGIWETKVTLKKGNIYSYKYLIDGNIWMTDPESELNIDDGFGGKNSFIQL